MVNGKSVKEWIDLINDDVQRNGKPQIIVLFLSNYEEKMYGELKRFISCQLAIPSQAIRKRTFASKNPLSAASKVILQMNAKIGGTLWETVKRNKYFDKRRIMYGGLSLSKGKKGFTLGFVGTINN